jgi:hypothetical protein
MYEEGDCLVLMTTNGCYWTGNAWVADYTHAKRFPPGTGYEACLAESRRVAEETGIECVPVSIQPHKRPDPPSPSKVAVVLRKLAAVLPRF